MMEEPGGEYKIERSGGYVILADPYRVWRFERDAVNEAARRTMGDGNDRTVAQVVVVRRVAKEGA